MQALYRIPSLGHANATQRNIPVLDAATVNPCSECIIYYLRLAVREQWCPVRQHLKLKNYLCLPFSQYLVYFVV